MSIPIIEKIAGSLIREKHQNYLVGIGARLCEKYLTYYRNEKHWNMLKNGESLLLRTLASLGRQDQKIEVFDVGANRGIYALEVRRFLAHARVHCFEVVPQTRKILEEKLFGLKDIIIPEYGLSGQSGILKISYNPKYDDSAREVSLFSKATDQVIDCSVLSGDRYISENKIKDVRLLKIDCEGHDMAVLEGFSQSIKNSIFDVIQFEYGSTWIGPRRFMHEAYSLLEPAGYSIGRLYPDGVFFKKYDRLKDDRFYMGNYVAVSQRSENVRNALKMRGEK